MSDSTVRLVRMSMALAFLGWMVVMVSTYLIGAHGLNFSRYFTTTLALAFAAVGGFLLVWVALWMVKVRDHAVATPSPLLIAPPAPTDGLTSLESELIGFVQGYRHWPAPLPAANLYDQAMRRWNLMRGLPDTGPLHRITALASSLLPLMTTVETRTPAAWWHVGTPDGVTFHSRPAEEPPALHPLLSLPAFVALAEPHQQRVEAVLRALHTPHSPPADLDDVLAKLALVVQHAG